MKAQGKAMGKALGKTRKVAAKAEGVKATKK
jgi:hypothetical protein